MNFIKIVVGKMANAIVELSIQYKEYFNTNAVNNLGGGAIKGNCTVVYPQNITIGNRSYVNSGFLVASPNARIVIGDDCLISFNVHLRTDMHSYIDSSTPINQQGFTEKDIVIKDDVWIGFGAQIMAGVTIETGCVIGAGAIVTEDTEPYGVYAGVPAKLIKYRIVKGEEK